MIDFMTQATLSNIVVAAFLAVIAWLVQRRIRSASLANLLWALVLIKLITPPLFSIPVFEIPSYSSLSVSYNGSPSEFSHTIDPSGGSHFGDLPTTDPNQASDLFGKIISSPNRALGMAILYSLWLIVSTLLFVISISRIIRFHRYFKSNLTTQSNLMTTWSGDMARRMGLRKQPEILTTTANIAPFVWWTAGRSVIVVSQQASQQLSEQDFRLIVAHEMAHIKRRDHWFRWLEWSALVCCWWNPVMWWARTQPRISEEMACDSLVLQALPSNVQQYASSLLNMAELLASSAIRPPHVACAINSGGSLETRLKMMIGQKNWQAPTALRVAIVATAICLFPMGFVDAQDIDAVQRRLGGAVEAGELTLEQATVMLDALRETSSGTELQVKKRKYMQLEKQIVAAVAAGKISKEQAEEKLIAKRREMFDESNEDADLKAKKVKYAALEKEVAAAVKAGKLSEEDAENRLIDFRNKIFGQGVADDQKESEIAAKKRKYMAIEIEIDAAVKAGKLSNEQAQEKLIDLRREMLEPSIEPSSKNYEPYLSAKKLKFMAISKEIEAAVRAGKLSKEDSKSRLVETHKELFESDDK